MYVMYVLFRGYQESMTNIFGYFYHLSDAADNARLLCDQFYFASPDIIIKEHNGNRFFHAILNANFVFFCV